MTEIEAIQAVTREQVEAARFPYDPIDYTAALTGKPAVQCPKCGVRRNQQHRGWCSAPTMIKLPTPTTAGEVRE